jgi:hypothetical protein
VIGRDELPLIRLRVRLAQRTEGPRTGGAKIAAGVVGPDSGQIFLAGKAIRLSSPRVARQNGIVIVHQSTDQLGAPGLSVAENLVLDDLCTGTFGALAGNHKIRQRAEAVAGNASVLILDEPTASLSAPSAFARPTARQADAALRRLFTFLSIFSAIGYWPLAKRYLSPFPPRWNADASSSCGIVLIPD